MDFTYSIGTWGTDTVIGDVTVDDLYFAVANKSGSNVGVLGIGPKFMQTADEEYANLPFALKDKGIIKKVYLEEPDADEGTFLFGTIGPSKYTGPLMT